MRNASVFAVVNAMPASWNTPGIWGLPHTPHGMNFSGLPVVDGRVITHDYPTAMAIGLIDQPLMVGNMGQECDLGPDVDVKGQTDAQWRAYLNTTFAPWTNAPAPGAGEMLYAAYAKESAIDAQRAYDSINADYGLTCAFKQIAVNAKSASTASSASASSTADASDASAAGGVRVDNGTAGFTSPIYLYVNQWPPSHPIPTLSSFSIQWAFHTWDYNAAWGTWPLGLNVSASDVQLGNLLSGLWADFMQDGRLDPSTGWLSVEQVPGFPAHQGTFVIATPSLPPYANTSFVVDYKADKCGIMATLGLDQRYWWCD